MIIAKELRIGNYVKYGPNIKVVISLDNCIRVNGCDEWIFGDDNENISGIPITEELLLKIGFEKVSSHNDGYTNYKTKNNFCISRNNSYTFVYAEHPGKFYCGDNHTEIPSLHWLQNYYFFNYHHELEINL